MKTDGPPSRYWAAISGCVRLALLLTPAFAVCAMIGWQQSGAAGVAAAALAVGICGIGAMAALLLTVQAAAGGQRAVLGVLLGTVLRTAVPLISILAVPLWVPALQGTGFAGMVLGGYLLALAGETWLAARFIRSQSPSSASTDSPQAA